MAANGGLVSSPGPIMFGDGKPETWVQAPGSIPRAIREAEASVADAQSALVVAEMAVADAERELIVEQAGS